VPAVVLDRAAAERGGDVRARRARVILVPTGANLGFAGGCNVGMRYALAVGDFDYVWLLNNDTVVPPDALGALVERMEQDPGSGLCGSRIIFYDDPTTVQCLGGATYNPWLATTRRIGQGTPVARAVDPHEVERRTHCVYGASVLARSGFLLDVGLLEERYFMYFEEQDWAERSARRWKLAYAHESVVYHRDGRSAGSHVDARHRSAFSDVVSMRARLLLTRRFYRLALPTVYAASVAVAVKRALLGDVPRGVLLMRFLLGRLSWEAVRPPARAQGAGRGDVSGASG
jgi:hypothetical protein